MASSQSFSMIQRRISLSPLPASPVNSGLPLKTIAMRLPPSSPGKRPALRDHVLQKKEAAVVDARQASAEAAAFTLLLIFVADLLLVASHFTPKGGLANM